MASAVRYSISAASEFKRCPRMWFLGRYYAHALAHDPERMLATELAKTSSIDSLRGQAIEEVIQTKIFAPFRDNRPRTVLERAYRLLSQKISEHPNGTFSKFQRKLARAEIRLALKNLLTHNEFSKQVYTVLKPDKYHFERLLRFEVEISPHTPGVGKQDETAEVLAFPDVIVEEAGQSPIIIDWKVNRGKVGKNKRNRFQLFLYALAYSQIGGRPSLEDAANVRLLEVQLLAGKVIEHKASVEVLDEFLAYIRKTSTKMAQTYRVAAHYESPSNRELHWRMVPITSNTEVCEGCKFLSLCKRAPVIKKPALFT